MSSSSSPRRPTGPRASMPHGTSNDGQGDRVQGVLGVGLDGDDGHQRITQGDDFVLLGGSSDTHERLQELVLRMRDTLKKRGKRFGDLSRDEFEELAHDSMP